MTVLGRLSFFFGDLFFLNLAVALSFAFVKHQSNLSDQVYLFIFSNLTWIYLTLVANPYNINKSWSLSKIIKTQMAFLIIHLLVVGALIFFLEKTYGSIQILLVYLLFIPVFFAWKVIIYYIKKILTVDIIYRNYILIGRNALAEDIRRYYYSNSELGYKFIGYMNFSSGDELINEIRDINSKQSK
jgi:FlaA1/EpsC-like NDP-sugar epimerase